MLKKKSNIFILSGLVASDLLAIGAACLLAYYVRFFSFFAAPRGVPPLAQYVNALFYVAIVFLLVMNSCGAYARHKLPGFIDEVFLLLKAVLMAALVLMATTFIYREFSYSRSILLLASTFSYLFLVTSRWVAHVVRKRIASRNFKRERVLLIGGSKPIRRLIKGINADLSPRYEIAGVLSKNGEDQGKHLEGAKILGSVQAFDAVLEKEDVDEVIMGATELPREEIVRMILKCEEEMISFKLVADVLGMLTNSVAIENVNGVAVVGVKDSPLFDPWNRFLKRVMDLIISSIVLVLISPILGIVACLVKSEGGGPILFRQERVGEDGRTFELLKFRSMHVDAERDTGPVFTSERDPRRTRIGKVIRGLNLDELPQLWNVLKGEMSLVGPRPERPVFVDQLKSDIPRYMARHKIRSGITGWAQVNGLRAGTPTEERIKYDMYYVENWSLWLDFQILCMTPFALKNAL